MANLEDARAEARLPRANYRANYRRFEKSGKLRGLQTRGTRARGNLELLIKKCSKLNHETCGKLVVRMLAELCLKIEMR